MGGGGPSKSSLPGWALTQRAEDVPRICMCLRKATQRVILNKRANEFIANQAGASPSTGSSRRNRKHFSHAPWMGATVSLSSP
jgi:hypothetical protein